MVPECGVYHPRIGNGQNAVLSVICVCELVRYSHQAEAVGGTEDNPAVPQHFDMALMVRLHAQTFLNTRAAGLIDRGMFQAMPHK